MRNSYYALFPAFLIWLMLALPAQGAVPAQAADDMIVLDSGAIKEILKSDMILLDNNKRYRLDNVRVPPFEDDQAVNELKRVFLNKMVTVFTYRTNGGKNLDRYGVPLAQIVSDDDETWIQGYMVSKGLAWVFASEASNKMIEPLREMEAEARAEQLGFWKDPEYALKTPKSVKGYMNSFQVVEGTILSGITKKNNVFFNFEEDWKRDFTIRVPLNVWGVTSSEFSKTIFNVADPNTWRNHKVRVRGWVEEGNGPLIEVTNAGQIELISPPTPPKKAK